MSLRGYKKYIDEAIAAKLDEMWREGMADKTTLTRYRNHKKARGITEHLYDNTSGSRLLANARAGCLQTRKYRSRYKGFDATCQKCGIQEETLEHVLLECENPPQAETIIQIKLGLHDESTPKIIANTKKMLEDWEKKNISTSIAEEPSAQPTS